MKSHMITYDSMYSLFPLWNSTAEDTFVCPEDGIELVLERPSSFLFSAVEQICDTIHRTVLYTCVSSIPEPKATSPRIIVHAISRRRKTIKDSFTFTVNRDIHIYADTDTAAIYALRSFIIQYAAVRNVKIPAGSWQHTPAFMHRWCMFDFSRGHAVRLHVFDELLPFLTACRVNGVCICVNTHLQTPAFPDYTSNDAPTLKTLHTLAEKIRSYGMQFIPVLHCPECVEELSRYERFSGTHKAHNDSDPHIIAAHVRTMCEELLTATKPKACILISDNHIHSAAFKVYSACSAACKAADVKIHPLPVYDSAPNTGITDSGILYIQSDGGETGTHKEKATHIILQDACCEDTLTDAKSILLCQWKLSQGWTLLHALPPAGCAGVYGWHGQNAPDAPQAMAAVMSRIANASGKMWEQCISELHEKMKRLCTCFNTDKTSHITIDTLRKAWYEPHAFLQLVKCMTAHIPYSFISECDTFLWNAETICSDIDANTSFAVPVSAALRLSLCHLRTILRFYEECSRCRVEYHLAASDHGADSENARGHALRAGMALQSAAECYGELLEIHQLLWKKYGAPHRDMKALRAMYHHITRCATALERFGKRPYPLPEFHHFLATQFARDDGHFRDFQPYRLDEVDFTSL